MIPPLEYTGAGRNRRAGCANDRQSLSVARLEREHIQRVLADGNVSETARRLRLYRRTLQPKLAKRRRAG